MARILRLSLRRLTSDKRRAFSTGFAIIIGVAFLAATLVLGDTTRAGFKGLFAEANAGIDLAVRSEDGIGDAGDEMFVRGTTDEALVERIRQVPGVAAAAAQVEGTAQIIGADGSAIGGGGPPTVGAAWIDDPELSPYRIREGRAPQVDGEVLIDAYSAREGDIALGDTVEIRLPDLIESEVVGIATFGERDSFAGATLAAFDQDSAQRWFTGDDQVSAVLVRAEPGVDVAQLDALVSDTVSEVVGDGTEVITSAELTAEQEKAIEGDFLGMVTMMLLAFAGVALVVAGFSIYNTFTIMVSQRSRESSLLRALGASRPQVLSAVTIEAVLVGLVASLVGTGVGVGLAEGLRRLMASAGMDLGMESITINSAAVVTAVAVGLVITVLSSVIPAIKGSRAAPLAALRSTAVEATSVGRIRIAAGVFALAGGAAMVVTSGQMAADAAAEAASGGPAMSVLGIGALAALVGAVLLAPLAAIPFGHLLSRVTGALWPSGRISGRLAGRNVVRNPRRTASSAVALVVGVTVVTLFATMAVSMKGAMDDIVRRTFGGDIVVSAEWGSAGIGTDLASRIHELPEVDRAADLSYGLARVDGDDRDIVATDLNAIAGLTDLGVESGSFAGAGAGEVAVSRDFALENQVEVGDVVPVSFVDGTSLDLEVGAIYSETDFMGNVMLHSDDYLPHAGQSTVDVVLLSVAEGIDVSDAASSIEAAAGRGGPTVETRDEFIDSIAGEIDQALTLIYGLLGLAVLIALMGIANTLALSVHERTREIGLLRAVGQSRRQLRATVRWESVVTAVLGTVGGLGLGVFLGWGVVRAAFARSQGMDSALAVPTGSIVAIVVLAVLAAVIASVRPARRAARLDVLDALATV